MNESMKLAPIKLLIKDIQCLLDNENWSGETAYDVKANFDKDCLWVKDRESGKRFVIKITEEYQYDMD